MLKKRPLNKKKDTLLFLNSIVFILVPTNIKKNAMKTTLLTLIIVFTISKSTYSQCDFNENYSDTTGWTQIGTEVEIINGQLEFINGAADGYGPGGSANGSQRRVYKSLGTTLNANDAWSAEFEFTPSSVGTGSFTGHTLLALTAGIQEPFNDCPDLPCTGFPTGSQDGIIISYGSPNPGNGELHFRINTKDNTAEQGSLKIISNTLNITYYLRLERTSATDLKLSIFSDPTRTTHIPNSPITETIPNTVEGLNTVQHGNTVRGDDDRKLTGAIDNLCIVFNPPTGIFSSRLKENRLNLYPNPNSGKFVIDFDYLNINTQVEIYNLIGEKVFKENITKNKLSIDISDKPKGIYLVKIINNTNIQTKKIVTQ
tara:strand:+ start:243 stop:1355 length:1113 start_codon:yes stop_codon:yes gene_type:complete